MVAEGGEVEWFALSSTCSMKELLGLWDDEEEEKKRVECDGADCGVVVSIGESTTRSGSLEQ